ncbi:MAG: TonB-dependent receptor [Aestuariibacter sp.]
MITGKRHFAAGICGLMTGVIMGFTPATFANVQGNPEQAIESIVVRSYLRPSQVSDVASNIAVLDITAQQNIAATHITELLQTIPGTWISRGNGQEHLTAIRSPVLTGAGACGAFLMAEDNIPLRAAGFCNVNQLFGVNTEQAQSIEVIRGPAGVLYGSNAVHGVINVITPDSDSLPYFNLDLGPNEYGRFGWLNSAATDLGDLTVYGNLTTDGGYKDNSGFGQEKVSLVHQYRHSDWQSKSVFAYSNINQETSGFIQGERSYEDASLKRQNPNPEAYRDSRSIRGYSQWRYSAEEDKQLTLTPYFRWHDMAFLQHYLPWQAIENNGHSSVGLMSQWWQRIADVSYTLGLDVEATEGDLSEFQPEDFAPTLPQGMHYDFDVKATSASTYLDLQWQVNEDWQLQLGGRYSLIDYDYDNNLSDGSACDEAVNGCRFSRPPSQKLSFDHFTYRLAGLYRINDATQLFANITQGFRAPQATELFRLQAGQLTTDLKEEKTDGIELGVRGNSETLNAELSIYQQQKQQVIIQDTQRQFINGGETKHQGAEFAMGWKVHSNFSVDAALTYGRHTYDNSLRISRVNIKGNDIDTAPRWLGNLTANWQITPDWLSQLEWQFTDDYYLDPENSAQYYGHHLFNWRLHWQMNDAMKLSIRVRNLLDEDYAERADFAFGNYRYFVGEPRSVFLGLRYQL